MFHNEPKHYHFQNDKDYQGHVQTDAFAVGYYTIIGDREIQQDFLAWKNIPLKYANFTASQHQLALAATFMDMQKQYGNSPQDGSTGCAVTAWRDDNDLLQIITANLGDSLAYLIVVNSQGVATVKQLNTLHDLLNVSEQTRIKKAGGYIMEDKAKTLRLNARLALSRAFGDTNCVGISHEAQVTIEKIQLNKDDKAYIIVASDGLTLSPELIGKDIELVLKNDEQEKGKILENITLRLGIHTYNESTDNISLAAFDISSKPFSAAVFDGHGDQGEIVSGNISSNFYACLLGRMEGILQNNNEGEVSNEIIQYFLAMTEADNQSILERNKIAAILTNFPNLFKSRECEACVLSENHNNSKDIIHDPTTLNLLQYTVTLDFENVDINAVLALCEEHGIQFDQSIEDNSLELVWMPVWGEEAIPSSQALNNFVLGVQNYLKNSSQLKSSVYAEKRSQTLFSTMPSNSEDKSEISEPKKKELKK